MDTSLTSPFWNISLTSPFCFAYRGAESAFTFLLLPLAITLGISTLILFAVKGRATDTIPRYVLTLNAIVAYGTCVGLVAGFAKGHLATIAIPLPLGLFGMLVVYLLSADTWKSY